MGKAEPLVVEKELRDDSVRFEYISGLYKDKFGLDVSEEQIEFVDVGIMNYVYRVNHPEKVLYFKQSLEDAKHKDRVGGDLKKLHPLRTKHEMIATKRIEGMLPEGVIVPQVVNYDEANNIMVTSDIAGKGGDSLEKFLLAGDFNQRVASNMGKYLGIVHRNTFGKDNQIRDSFEEEMNNWKLFLNMRTRGIKPEGRVKEEMDKLYDEALAKHTYDVLLSQDCVPKNLVQAPGSVLGVLDLEISSGIGDPAYDIGVAVGHYFLFSILNNSSQQSLSAIEKMFTSYAQEADSLEIFGDYFKKRAIKYAGAMPIYRVAGSSPAAYISKEKIPELKDKGSRIILSDSSDIKDAISILREN